MKRVTLGQLRQAVLPAAKPDDDDLLVSLRKNIDSDHPDSLVLAIPDAMWELAGKMTLQPAKQALPGAVAEADPAADPAVERPAKRYR